MWQSAYRYMQHNQSQLCDSPNTTKRLSPTLDAIPVEYGHIIISYPIEIGEIVTLWLDSSLV